MTDRIELILKTQNLTPTQFADAIGIQRSSMSHILARRNKPSLDFAMKLLHRFPEINAEWLLTGKNQMFSSGAPSPALFPQETVQANPQVPEFEWDSGDAVADVHVRDNKTASFGTDYKSAPAGEPQRPADSVVERSRNAEATDSPKKVPLEIKQDINQSSDIERIIVFFTDGTFKSYT